MAQDLNAIIQELDASYNPSRQSINDRINSLQGAEQADMQGLQGTQTQAFGDIVNNAQERGVAFGGVPLGEQAKYTSTQFLPAVAKLKGNYVQARGGLSDALNSLNLDQNKTALSIREAQQGRDFQAQQAELQRQAEARARAAADSSSNALSSLLSGGGGPQQQNSGLPEGMDKRVDKLGKFTGFNFNVGGKAASAAQYAAANKLPLGDVLYKMATAGDQTAANAYRWMQSIQGTDAFKSGAFKNSPAYKNTFSSLFWGT